MLNRLPTQLPPLWMLVDDIGRPSPRQLAKSLDVNRLVEGKEAYKFAEGIVTDDLLPEQVERLLADRDTWTEMLRANTAFIAKRADALQRVKAGQYRLLKRLMKAKNITVTWEKV